MAHSVALVDLSWALYKYRHYYKNTCRISYRVDSISPHKEEMIPTGHVYGTINTIQQLASQYKAVILAVDSKAHERYEVLPTYKAGRHVPSGDPYDDYPIMTDLMNILKICTFQKNVFYIKHEGLESDDIIASWISYSIWTKNWDMYCYFNDVDILQTIGEYHWCRSFHEPPVDRESYIKDKFGLDLMVLPIWWKVIRGDPSDGIPSSIPRFPGKKLIELCMRGELLGASLESFLKALGMVTTLTNEIIENITRNYMVLQPILKPVGDFKLKRLGASFEELRDLLVYYQINDFVLQGG